MQKMHNFQLQVPVLILPRVRYRGRREGVREGGRGGGGGGGGKPEQYTGLVM